MPKILSMVERNVLYVIGVPRGFMPGGFFEHIIRAILYADKGNKELLRSIFPDYVRAVEAFKSGELEEKETPGAAAYDYNFDEYGDRQ